MLPPARRWARAQRPLILLTIALVAAALGLPGAVVGSGLATSPDEDYPWAGQWTSSFGGFAFSVRTEQDGRGLLERIGGKPCSGSSQYYAGGYNNADDVGKIRGCTLGINRLVGRYESNKTKQRGSFDIHRTTGSPGWKGTWSRDSGERGSWSGTFKRHFNGDRPQAAPGAIRNWREVPQRLKQAVRVDLGDTARLVLIDPAGTGRVLVVQHGARVQVCSTSIFVHQLFITGRYAQRYAEVRRGQCRWIFDVITGRTNVRLMAATKSGCIKIFNRLQTNEKHAIYVLRKGTTRATDGDLLDSLRCWGAPGIARS